MSPKSQGLYLADEGYVIPPATDDGYVPTVLDICRESDVDVLIHGSEGDLSIHSSNREVFEDEGLYLPINAPGVIETCKNKLHSAYRLSELGFEVPESHLLKSASDISELNEFPLVLKPLGGGGSKDTYIAQNHDNLQFFVEYLLDQYDEIMAQQYVGTPADEFTVGVLHDHNGEYVNSIAVNRDIQSGLSGRLQVNNRTGHDRYSDVLAISSGVSQGQVGRFPDICRQCRRIADALGSRGPMNIQCRYVDGFVYTFEINARFSGTSSLRSMVGFNEVDLLIRKHLLDETIERGFEYSEGYIFRGLSETFTPKLQPLYEGGVED